VDVPDLEPRALAREPTGPERRQPALVGQPGEGVGLVHELRQLRCAEELLDARDHRADVDQRLRRDRLDVLRGHPLADDSFHARQTDPDLVLDQLAHRAQPPVPEVVDVVGLVAILTGVQLHEVADRAEHVLVGQDPLVLRPVLALLVLLELRPGAELRLVPPLLVGVVELGELLEASLELRLEHALGRLELLVDLVAPHPREVVALGVEEQVLQERAGGLGRRGLTRPQLAVDVLEGLLGGLDVVLLEGILDRLGLVEQREDLVRGPAERLEQHRDVLPALAVDPDADGVLLVDVELQPRPAAGDDLGDVDVLVGGLVQLSAEVDPRRAHELGHDHPLGAVDDEGAALGHHGEVPHEDLLLLDLAGRLVDEHRLDEQRSGEGGVLVLALLLGELLVLEGVLTEMQLELFGEVLDRRDFLEDLLQTFGQEPIERLPLDAHEVGKR
jgi:hypothetical protein